jgi:hypothetical protein
MEYMVWHAMRYAFRLAGTGKNWFSTLYIKQWCLDHCAHPYRVQSEGGFNQPRKIHVHFECDTDRIKFMLSDAYNHLQNDLTN